MCIRDRCTDDEEIKPVHVLGLLESFWCREVKLTVVKYFRPVFRSLPETYQVGVWYVNMVVTHVINIPKADWSRVKNKQLTATPC